MMNTEPPKIKTVTVLLVNVDDRQRAMLRMAFKMHNTINYQILDAGDTTTAPDLVLVDGDVASGDDRWKQSKQLYPQACVVYFSRNPPVFTAPYLAKPIKFDTLFAQLRNLQQGNGIWLAGSVLHDSAASPADELIRSVLSDTAKPDLFSATAESSVGSKGHPLFDRDTSAAPQAAPARPASAPQPGAAAQPHSPIQKTEVRQEVTVNRFHPKGTLLGLMMQVVKQNQDVAVLVDGKPALIVFPQDQKVALAAESDVLQKMCEQENLTLGTREVTNAEALREKAKLTTTSCLWQLAIWSAQGRLIDPIMPTTTLKLRAWPNMTRLAYLPDAIRLSAFLVRSPVTLSALYKLLPVDMSNLLNFVTATYATGFLQIEQPLGAASSAAHQHKAEEKLVMAREKAPETSTSSSGGDSVQDKQPKGLLARLMSRLRGK